jgi:hypothetical protein
VGDILVMQETSLILRLMHQAKNIDIAVLYDEKNPAGSDDVFKSINSENGLFHIASILPVVQVNPFLGSVLLFNSKNQLEKYISNGDEYCLVWPSGWELNVTREYLYYQMLEEIIYPYYIANQSIPYLRSRQSLEDWAIEFISQNISGDICISVNIRNNPNHHLERNSNLKEWKKLFVNCQDKLPIKFIVICSLSEIDTDLRGLENLIFAKDFHTTVEQDLALIAASDIHMGTSSGPATMAWFSEKPYFIVNATLDQEYFRSNKIIKINGEGYIKFSFSKDGQFFYTGRETFEILKKNLLEMIDIFKINKINKNIKSKNIKINNWLR